LGESQEHALVKSKSCVPTVVGFEGIVNRIVAVRAALGFFVNDAGTLGELFEKS
jgi:hypothetical protein